jgi:hypothetical protein
MVHIAKQSEGRPPPPRNPGPSSQPPEHELCVRSIGVHAESSAMFATAEIAPGVVVRGTVDQWADLALMIAHMASEVHSLKNPTWRHRR